MPASASDFNRVDDVCCLLPCCKQGQLALTDAQVALLKEAHKRLADQLLNVTAERFHVLNILRVSCLLRRCQSKGENHALESSHMILPYMDGACIRSSVLGVDEPLRIDLPIVASISGAVYCLQEACPDVQNRPGQLWQGSITYLRMIDAQKRLAASLHHEHSQMRQAHATFRQASLPVVSQL
jgi:hypothetical protein